MKISIKLTINHATALIEMLQAALVYYEKKAISNSIPIDSIEDVFMCDAIRDLHEKISLKVHRLERSFNNKATYNFTNQEIFVLSKAEIPVFNNPYHSQIKQNIFDVCMQAVMNQQTLYCLNISRQNQKQLYL